MVCENNIDDAQQLTLPKLDAEFVHLQIHFYSPSPIEVVKQQVFLEFLKFDSQCSYFYYTLKPKIIILWINFAIARFVHKLLFA